MRINLCVCVLEFCANAIVCALLSACVSHTVQLDWCNTVKRQDLANMARLLHTTVAYWLKHRETPDADTKTNMNTLSFKVGFEVITIIIIIIIIIIIATDSSWDRCRLYRCLVRALNRIQLQHYWQCLSMIVVPQLVPVVIVVMIHAPFYCKGRKNKLWNTFRWPSSGEGKWTKLTLEKLLI